MKTRKRLFHYGHNVWLPINADLWAVFNAARKDLRRGDLVTEHRSHLLAVKRVYKDYLMHNLQRWQQCLEEIELYRADKRERELRELSYDI